MPSTTDFFVMLTDARCIKVQASKLSEALDKASVAFGYSANTDDEEGWDRFLDDINIVEYKTQSNRIRHNYKYGEPEVYPLDTPYTLEKFTDNRYLIQKNEQQVQVNAG